MDKRTAWMSGVLALVLSFGIGGTSYSMYHRQAERLDVLQRETKEKDNQLNQLTNQVKNLEAKLAEQQRVVEEVNKKTNF